MPQLRFRAVLSAFVLVFASTLVGYAQTDALVGPASRPWACWALARVTDARFGTIADDACRSYPVQASSIHLLPPSATSIAAPIVAPGAPSGLVGTVSGRTVLFTWTPASGDAATSFVLEAGSASGRSDLANSDTGSPSPVLTATDVPPGSYFVRVRARNASGTSAASNEVAITVQGTGGCSGAPGAPTGLTAAASGTSVTLSWQPPSGGCAPTTYTIEAGSGSGLSNLTVFSTGNAATSLSASGVGSGIYFVRVRSANSSGTSAASNEVQFLISNGTGPCAGPPSTPASLIGSVSGTTVVLSWFASTGSPTSYVIEAGTASGLTNLVVSDTGSTATTLTATAGAGTYYIRVRSKGVCGTSGASNEIVLTVGGTPSPTLLDAGAYGLVRVASTTGLKVSPMICFVSDGNAGFRPDKTFTVDPTNAAHLYVAIEDLGFFVSNDGGATWQRSSAGIIGYPRVDDPTKPCITEMSELALDAQDPRHLLLARPGDPGTIANYFAENQGIYESRDGGASWRQIMTQPGINIYVHDGLAFAPTNPRIIYAGSTTNPRTVDGSGRVFSTVGVINGTKDGGTTWAELPTGAPLDIGVSGLFVGEDSQTVTAFTQGRVKDPSGDPNKTTFGPGLGTIKTTDGGATWRQIDPGTQVYNSPNVARRSVSHVVRISFDGQIVFSSDGGATFPIAKRLPGIPPPNVRTVWLNPYDATGLTGLAGDDLGGVWLMSDGGNTITAAGQVAAVPSFTTRLSKLEWGPDGAWYASGHYIGTVSGVPTQEGFVFRSRDNGASWVRILNTSALPR